MFGIDDAVAAGSKLIDDIVTRIWPDATQNEKDKAMLALSELQNQYATQLKQIDVNAVEAQSHSLFVSGWRPFVGWVCGGAFAYEFVVRPLINGVLALFSVSMAFPGIEVDAINTLLFGLLGLGAYRTVEKVKGVARKS